MYTSVYPTTVKESEKNESQSAINDALIASEARYRRLFETAKDGILILNAETGKIIDVNPFLGDLLGYSKEELIGKEIWEIGFFKDIAANKEKFHELQKEKYVRYDDLPLETTNGRKINVEFVSNVYWVDKKKVIQCNIRDITKRKQAERSLLESENKFKSYIDFAPDGIFVVDESGKYVDINDSACKMTGYSKTELLKMSITDILAEESFEDGLQHFKNLAEKGISKGDLSYKQKNGSCKWWSLDAVKLSEKRLLGFAKDITERKLAEEEIAILSQSLKSINECVSITDLNDNILFVNESFLKTYGYDKNELIGKNINIIRSLNNTHVVVEEILPATISGEWQGELLNRKKEGSEFPIYLSTSVIRDKENKVLGLIGVATDITERKLIEKELIASKEKAEESDRLKSAFLANMSHEIRTPLNSIIGFSELLGDPDFDKIQQNEFIQHIITNGNSLLSIISDIMDISKMESGECKIHAIQINAHQFISNVKKHFAIQVEGKKLELKLTLPVNGEKTIIFADTDRLNQVFNNLISNAVKFTKTGSIEIGYTLKSTNPNVVYAEGIAGEPVELEFFVKDTGIGIPAEYQNKIFERFRQVDTSNTRKFGGNGLGLSISKNLVELMGGKIWFESDPDNHRKHKGSKFSFTVPIYSETIK
jgi:PAS domain S-box-containing protein